VCLRETEVESGLFALGNGISSMSF
jgi:hypothetical protein